MSFVTNAATRRGKRAKTEFSSPGNTLPTPNGGQTVSQSWVQGDSVSMVTRQPQLKYATVGDDMTKGLTIVGTSGFASNAPTNPDELDIPNTMGGDDDGIAKDKVINPDFPVSFQGRGTLKFVDSVRIPSIDQSVSISRNLHVGGTLTVGSSQFPLMEYTDFSDLVTLEGDSGVCTMSASTRAYGQRIGHFVFLSIYIQWTSKNTIDNADEIFFDGIPWTINESGGEILITSYNGIKVADLNHNLYGVPIGSSTISLRYLRHGTHQNEVVVGSELDPTGYFQMTGILHL